MKVYVSTTEYANRSNIAQDEVVRMFKSGVLEGKQESKGSKIYILVDDTPSLKNDDAEIKMMLSAICKHFNIPLEGVNYESNLRSNG